MMIDPETEYQRWNSLQEPARASQVPAAYLLMLSALDNGWKIQEPVCIQINASSAGPLTFLVGLVRAEDSARYNLLVHDCPQMEHFIRTEKIRVKISLDVDSQQLNPAWLQ